MYNFLVSAMPGTWDGEPWKVELSRCVREYTDNEITSRYGELDAAAIAELKRFPSLFAYESGNDLAPKFGVIRDIIKRQGDVRIQYEIVPVEPFLTHRDLVALSFELDIGKWELNRTHWARVSV
jgi:hypothetical protein